MGNFVYNFFNQSLLYLLVDYCYASDGIKILYLTKIEVNLLQETWYLLDTGYHDAAINMAIDEALLIWNSEGKIRPVIRFYGWEKPSLSLGHFQRAEKAIDFSGVEKHGCQVVRRLTGGSAVLHDDEITYSITVPESHPKIPATVNEAYYVLSQGILKGYQLLGIDAQFAIPEKELRKERTAVCFEKPAIYEMIVEGKKISGNAQTRKSGVLLQHGSIPRRFDVDMLFDMFQFSSEEKRARQREKFREKAISIYDVTKKDYTYEQLRDAFIEGFTSSLDIQLETMTLTATDWEFIHELADTKYRTDEWNIFDRKRERSL